VRRLDPARILPSHLPPAIGRLEQLLAVIESVPDAPRFEPPDAIAFGHIAAALLSAP